MNTIKKLFLISLLFLAGTWFYACDSDNEIDEPQPKIEFSVSESDLDFKIAGETKYIEIKSSESWRSEIEGGKTWITITPDTGNDTGNVGIQITENTTGKLRTGVINFYCGDTSKKLTVSQNGAELNISNRAIFFDEKGTPQTITVSSNTNWTLSNITEVQWVTSSAVGGEGENFELTLTPTAYTEREPRGPDKIYFESYGVRDVITVSQKMPHNAPSVPRLIMPSNNSTEVNTNPTFQWEEAIDPDGDILTYKISISRDGTNWNITKDGINGTSGTCGTTLDDSTTYYWKVTASDPFGESTDSEVFQFTTIKFDGYQDGEVVVYQEATAGAPNPIILPFTGDGFIKEDFVYGGAFDKAMDEAIEGFFSIEPYKTYRQYFKVYKIAAHSKERGVTVQLNMGSLGPNAKKRNTAYSCVMRGGGSTRIDADIEAVIDYTKLLPEVTLNKDLYDIALQLIINENAYAGTCGNFSVGFSYAMVPMSSTEFIKLVNHEGGGHGFGRLADEYFSEGTISQEEIDEVNNEWRGDHPDGAFYYNGNVDYSGSVVTSHWYHYLSKEGYGAVGYYEGGDLYSKGVWRPEYNSCMNNNVPYYNAPSREAIVRRIKRISGKGFSYDDFYSKDLIRSESAAQGAKARAPEMVYPMTAPPVRYPGSPFDYINK